MRLNNKMRITTWNVNGYRAVTRKNGFDWVKQLSPDILCLQEIKVKPEQLTPEEQIIADYSVIWNPAERPGYSGTAIFHRGNLSEVTLGLGQDEFDSEGRVIRVKASNYYLYNIYFPNGGQENLRVPFKLRFYELLLNIIDEHHKNGEQVIITGDFNTAHKEIDLKNPKENEKNTGFLPEERVWIDTYLAHDLVDIYRHLYPEKVAYTWWTYRMNARARNIGWRLDYFLISKGMADQVVDVEIHDELMGSDHCPVSLILRN